MEKLTDWIKLWRELAEAQSRRWHKRDDSEDRWRQKARGFDQGVRERWVAKPDSSREFVVAQLMAHPGSTVLDIGAGTGAWTVLMARHARRVTAVEPSGAMIGVMEENLAAEGITNVEIVQQTWPEAQVEPHDFSLCSHAMYGCPDFPAFVWRMVEVTSRTCFLLMRAPIKDGVMAEAAMRVWGQPYDSGNFQVAYNAMLQMGLFPNVLMEDTGLWNPWTSASFDEALAEVKQRLCLGEDSEHDEFLADLLHRRLKYEDGRYVWPRGVRSALVYWDGAD
jgi:2-polyprenyl-3-methyl-5-hydroxy-6-metoxy-1,4-benzoquinol methylase